MGSLIAYGAAALLAAATAPAGSGDQAPDAAAERKKLEEQIAKELGQAPSAAGAPAQPAPAAPPTGQAVGGSPLARVLMLPDISAIGSGAAVWNTLDVPVESPRSGPVPMAPHKVTPVFEELELGIQAVVDPYARADAFVSFGPDGVDVEEAYLTTLSLPAGFQIRAGKLKSPFGRLNQQHPHVWDFADAPLALTRLVAPESLSGAGADVSWLAPVPWFAELHLAGQVTTPVAPVGMEAAGRRTAIGRLAQFFDLTESATLGVGLSGALVELPGDASERLGAADLFLKIRPLRSRAYLAVTAELFARGLSGAESGQQDLGWYAQAVWRQDAFWAYGLRYDRAPGVAGGAEQRGSAILAYLPSEFLRLRLQGGVDRLASGRVGYEGILALEFAVGAHGAHPF